MFARFLACLTAFLGLALVTPAFAAVPEPWGINFQPAASPTMAKVHEFHHLLLYIIIGIVLFVTALLLIIIFRFNEKRNPTPSKTSHNTLLEVVWTAIPVLILVVIAIPSFRLLYYADKSPDPEMTLKVVGHQWYWSYEYPDQGDIAFDSYMIRDEDLKPEDRALRLLKVDNEVVLPVNTRIQVLVTAQDVIHSWAMPAFGVKKDAIPGRMNETWLEIDRPGTYYGQCSEICGTGHAFMPIAIRAVSKEDFAAWVQEKGGKMPVAKVQQPEQVTRTVTTPAIQDVRSDTANAPTLGTATASAVPR